MLERTLEIAINGSTKRETIKIGLLLHARLKSKAAKKKVSMREYIRRAIAWKMGSDTKWNANQFVNLRAKKADNSRAQVVRDIVVDYMDTFR